MSLLHRPHQNHHIYSFLQSKELNALYLSYGLINFALGMVSLFVPIYLYKLGFSIAGVLLFYFIMQSSFVLLAYRGARVFSRYGVKHTFAIAIVLQILFFLGLKLLPGAGWLFFILPVVYAVKTMLYAYSFHVNFILHSDSKNRGKEVSMAQAAALVGSLLSPLIGGVLIKLFGFNTLFLVATFFLVVSLVPLLSFKEEYEKITFDKSNLYKDIFRRKNLPKTMSFTGYAVEDLIGGVIWPLFLFVSFLSIESIGLVSTLVAGLTFLTFYFVGKITDKRDKRQLLKIGTILYFFGWLARLFVAGFFSLLFIDTYKDISSRILQIPWSAYSYDLASKSNYFKFIVQREITFDLSRAIIMPFLILIFIINFHPFILSFVLAAFSSLFYASLSKAEIIDKVLEYEKTS